MFNSSKLSSKTNMQEN